MGVAYIAGRSEALHRETADRTGNQSPTENGRLHALDREFKQFPSIAASKGHILIVDDDASVRETLADLLEIVGYSPIQAADAMEALTILRRETVVDALVSDLAMPGVDGLTLIRRARELRHALPAILLTGSADQIASSATIGGCRFEILRKPVLGERLLTQLELLVAKSPDQ